MGLLKSGPCDCALQRAEISLGDFVSQSVLLKVCFQRARRMQCERAGVVHLSATSQSVEPQEPRIAWVLTTQRSGLGQCWGVSPPIVHHGDYPLCDTQLFG